MAKVAGFDPGPIFDVLLRHQVEFIGIGGIAATTYCSSYVTLDADICYARTPENMRKLAAALRGLGATLRGAPPGLPFKLDEKTLAMGLNFTFETKYGPLNTLGEISGVGAYEDMLGDALDADVGGVKIRVMSLPKLIASKKAAGRPKDKMLLLELNLLLGAQGAVDRHREQRRGNSGGGNSAKKK